MLGIKRQGIKPPYESATGAILFQSHFEFKIKIAPKMRLNTHPYLEGTINGKQQRHTEGDGPVDVPMLICCAW
jgi:hypothetical protein